MLGGRWTLARERRRRSVLIVRLAAEVYRREHAAAPTTAGALLGPYLKELPEGIARPTRSRTALIEGGRRSRGGRPDRGHRVALGQIQFETGLGFEPT